MKGSVTTKDGRKKKSCFHLRVEGMSKNMEAPVRYYLCFKAVTICPAQLSDTLSLATFVTSAHTREVSFPFDDVYLLYAVTTGVGNSL